MAEEKKMTLEEVNEHMKQKCGFVPRMFQIYAFEYALKCLDIEAKYRKGEKWEYLPAPRFDHGVF